VTTPLDRATETVAIAQREVRVANSLVSEYRHKMRLADDELSAASDRLYRAQNALGQIALDRHASTYGHPLTDEDRSEFEKRWDTKVDELRATRDAFAQKMAANNTADPDHPDHIHEDCCK